jgi:hypothetical protein
MTRWEFAPLAGAGLAAVGIYLESTPLVLAATLASLGSVAVWVRVTAPHDHWEEFRKKRPWDP